MAYNSGWTTNLSPEDKENFEKSLANSKKVLDRLQEICYNMVRESEGSLKNNYDNPNWALRAADSVGYQRALQRMISLLTHTEDKRGR